MYKLHCDLCERDMSKDENTTQVTWKDNNGYGFQWEYAIGEWKDGKCIY